MQYAIDVSSIVYSDVDKTLMNVDSTNQFGECPQEGGKQGNPSTYDIESSSKDDEAS